MPGFLGGSSGSSGTGGEITFPKEFIDPVTKLRVSQPENLIDTDFEYGLQPTKWETVELINNTPSFFSKSGDTTIPGIVSIATNNGTREITVTTATDHNLAVGIPINVTGTKSVTADGSYVINSIPNTTTFTYLCKDEQIGNNAIEDLYTSIITGEFFQGSQIRIADSEGITTDAEGVSTLTVKTDSTHGFGLNTPFYFLNLNSTISQEFEASNTAAKSFDSSNSATAQTFDGSNTLSTFNIDWSNSATVGGTTSTINSVSTVNNTITVAHGAETFANQLLGTPLYYNLTTPASSGYFNTNPRGVVFLKTVDTLNSPVGSSTFQVSSVPDGEVIPIVSSMLGTFQLANQARTFAGNNLNSNTQTSLTVIKETNFEFDGGNQGYAGTTVSNGLCTVEGYSGTILVSTTAGAGLDYYQGAMVLYSTTGSAASGLTNNTTYFIDTFVSTATPNQYRITIKALPTSASALAPTGGSGDQTFQKIGISTDKDIVHIRNSNFAQRDMIEYSSFPVGGRFTPSTEAETKIFYFVDTVYDNHNYQLSESLFSPVVATGGVTTDVVTRGATYRVHTFANVGTSNFVVTAGGNVEYLIIGGGGGAGNSNGCSGGGAGGYRSSVRGELSGGNSAPESMAVVTPQTYSIVVGGGGAGSSNYLSSQGTNGANSSAFGITALGGGGGGSETNSLRQGRVGGSGGGGVRNNDGVTAAGTAGQGFAGGINVNDGSPQYAGGGGGGAGGVGVNGQAQGYGQGGPGLPSLISGSLVMRGGGGGAGYYQDGLGQQYSSSGGSGGGGNGGSDPIAAAGASGRNGAPNTGGGGGGHGILSSGGNTGGTGGSGVVIVRYPITPPAPVATVATGGTSTTTQVVGDTTYRIHTFSTVGTSTFTLTTVGNLGPIEYLIVAGGGSGGTGDSGNDGGGGGGAGGLIHGSSNTLTATNYSIVVGAGGPGINGTVRVAGNPGNNSSAFGLTAIGGGRGGQPNSAGGAGGSGGGAGGGGGPGFLGGTATAGQGFAGGYNYAGPSYTGAGGGGALGGGGWSGSGRRGGEGGNGYQSAISGTMVIYSAGGGGGSGIGSGNLQGGRGGSQETGGAGGDVNDTGSGGFGKAGTTPGSASGGGGNRGYTTAAGRDGIVIIRYPIAIAV